MRFLIGFVSRLHLRFCFFLKRTLSLYIKMLDHLLICSSVRSFVRSFARSFIRSLWVRSLNSWLVHSLDTWSYFYHLIIWAEDMWQKHITVIKKQIIWVVIQSTFRMRQLSLLHITPELMSCFIQNMLWCIKETVELKGLSIATSELTSCPARHLDIRFQ